MDDWTGLLLPCPFCNGKARPEDTGAGWKIVCTECGVRTPDGHTLCLDASAEWNKRECPPPLLKDIRGDIVRSYLTLQCNSADAKKYLAPDLRQSLADSLIDDTERKMAEHGLGPEDMERD